MQMIQQDEEEFCFKTYKNIDKHGLVYSRY